ncbi:MAG: alpha/beta hydrolase [Blastocatellia bacterium]
MDRDNQVLDIAKRTVLYRVPEMDSVTVRRDVDYGSPGRGLTMDIYYPPGWKPADRTPAVVVVAGYPDLGFKTKVGCLFKEMGSSISWGRLMAASGLAAICYTNRDPTVDFDALIRDIHQNAAALGIDANRIGLWASSGNVPLALSTLMEKDRGYLRCAALCYGYTLDMEGFTAVAETARTFGFVNPAAGKWVNDIRPDVPLFIARAGQDQLPHLNDTLDRFITRSLACNLPITFTNHRDGPHAFDLLHDSGTTRDIVRQILAFLRAHLLPEPSGKM